ncbi:MAG: murein biosynthesis integral membrane protein MurJ, partial [Pseudomonadota bacterium]
GFMRDAERYGLAVELSRLTFTYLPLISLVALMGGLLNAENKFAPFAAAPIFFNACLISTLLFAAPYVATPGHALAYGVVAAGIVQVLWMLWNLARNGIVLRPRLPRLSPDMRGMLKLMAPGALTASVMQINLFVDVLLASLLPIGAVSYLYYADRLYQLPLGIIGAAVGTALLPVLSRQIAAAKDKGADQGEALETQGTALEIGLLVSLPATFLMAVMPAPMIAVLFERGAFGPEETAATALALAAYAIGIPAHIMTRVFNSSHFARKDTVGPAKIAMLCTLTNVALSLALIGPYAHAGIALATTLAFWLNAILLFINLYRKGQFVLPGDRVRRLVSQLLAAAACVGAAAWIHAALQPIWPGTDTLTRAIVLTIAFAGGAAAFIAIGTATGCLNRTAIQRLTGRSA